MIPLVDESQFHPTQCNFYRWLIEYGLLMESNAGMHFLHYMYKLESGDLHAPLDQALPLTIFQSILKFNETL